MAAAPKRVPPRRSATLSRRATSGRPGPTPDRADRRWAVAVALALTAAVGALPPPAAAGISCVVAPPEGPTPDHVHEARARFAAAATETGGGWQEKADRARAIRRQVADGLLDGREAAGRSIVSGNLRVPVLLNLYADSGTEPVPAATVQLSLFGPSSGPTIPKYYEEVSYGNLNVEGQVSGWRTLPSNQIAYTGLNNGLQGTGPFFVLAALLAHDATFDFSQFDNDGPDGTPNSGDDDGFVDVVVVAHPQGGAECGAPWTFAMWSHQWSLSEGGFGPIPTNDARFGGGQIMVDEYCVAPALACDGSVTDIGVYCHELGHVLGLPDLYDTQKSGAFAGDSEGIGWWGLMGAGSWNSTSRPAHMIAFCKERLGWLSYLDIQTDLLNLCLPPIEVNPTAVRIWSGGQYGDEYFVVENRQQLGFDMSLAGEGLLITHVNEDIYDLLRPMNQVNAFENAKAVDVECGDAYTSSHVVDADHLDDKTNRGDGTDPWCQETGSWHFWPGSIPDSRAYSNAATFIEVDNIGSCNGGTGAPADWVCADYIVGVPSPLDLCLADCPSDDCNEIATCDEWWASPALWIRNFELGGGHDIPAPGIDNKLHIKIRNLGPNDAANVDITAYGAKGAMGLTWPDDAEFTVGTEEIALLPANTSVTETIVFPYPEELALISHYCIGVVVEHIQDPALSNSAPRSNNLAQVNSQVLVDRALGGDPALAGGPASGSGPAGGGGRAVACPGSYSKDTRIYLYDGLNQEGGPVQAQIRIGTPPAFDDAVIPDTWTVSILPGTIHTLFPGVKDSVTVRASSPSAAHGEFAYVPLTLWDVTRNEAIGGIKLRFEVDCYDPLAPENGHAEWIPVPGDAPDGATVLVEWDPVLLDTQGNPERVMRYDVYRKSDQSPFEVLVGKVAIDADPGTAGFQWLDTVPRNECTIVYTYRVRAVDLTGGAGDYSLPFDLTCAGVVAALESTDGERARVFPNPTSGATTISFRVPEAGAVRVAVYNARGERVRVLEEGRRTAGAHEAAWDGRDDAGRTVASGVYFTRVTGPGLRETRKLVLTR